MLGTNKQYGVRKMKMNFSPKGLAKTNWREYNTGIGENPAAVRQYYKEENYI